MIPTGAKIMVVDDSRIDLDVTREILEAGGHEVTPVRLPTLVPLLTRHLKPDLILLDVLMDEIQGDELSDVIRQRMGNARSDSWDPVILLFSVKAESELQDLVAGCAADGYIRKSTDHEALLNSVNTWLARDQSPKARPTFVSEN